MKWFIFHCFLLACIVLTLAEKDSTRSKRDFSYIKGIVDSIFGGQKNIKSPVPLNGGDNVKIYRIEGVNNTFLIVLGKKLVLLVPTASPSIHFENQGSTVFEDETASIVGSYLGTKHYNEALQGLQGVKNLMASGILEDKSKTLQTVQLIKNRFFNKKFGTDIVCVNLAHGQLCINVKDGKNFILNNGSIISTSSGQLIESFKPALQKPVVLISKPHSQILSNPIIVEDMESVLIGIPPTPSPNYYYKQIHKDGHTTTYTANDKQNVMVKNSNEPIPSNAHVKIKDILNLGVSTVQVGAPIPIIGSVHNIQNNLQNVPAKTQEPFVVPSTIGANKYFYKQIHKDGSTTTYTGNSEKLDVKSSVPMPALVTDRINPIQAAVLPGKRVNNVVLVDHNPVMNIHLQQGKGYYKSSINIKNEKENNNLNGDNHKVENIAKTKSGSFSYKTIHKDGSVTSYSSSGLLEEIGNPGVSYNDQVSGQDKVTKVTNKMPVIHSFTNNDDIYKNYQDNSNVPIHKGSFIYKTIHNDGSITSYLGNGLKDEKTSVPSVLPKITPTLNTNMVYPYPVKIEEAGDLNRPSKIFSYKTIHNDGSVTSYLGNVINDEKTSMSSFPKFNPIVNTNMVNSYPVKVEEVDKPNGLNRSPDRFSYKTIHNDKSVTDHVINQISSDNIIEKNYDDGNKMLNLHASIDKNKNHFSYKNINNDGSVTEYFGNGEVKDTKDTQAKNQYNKNVLYNNLHNENKNIPSNAHYIPNIGSFSYSTVHSDGSVTNYAGTKLSDSDKILGIMGEKLIQDSSIHKDGYVTKYASKDIFIEDNNANPILESTEINQKPNNINIASKGNISSFSYKTMHKDGSVTNYSNDNEISEKTQFITSAQLNNVGIKLVNKPLIVTGDTQPLGKHSSNTDSVHSIGQVICNSEEKQPTVSNKIVPAIPINSRYVYKQVHHNVPNISNDTEVKTNVNIFSSTEKDNFIYRQVTNNGVYINKDGLSEFKSDVKPINPDDTVKIATNADDLKEENSLSKNPIVVVDESMSYSYTQKNSDGSSLSIEKNRGDNDVIVNFNEAEPETSRNRGDIPEALINN